MLKQWNERLRAWLTRFPRETRWPIVLDRRRIYILPTPEGLFFAGVLVAMLFGAINYELSLGHALVFLLAGLGVAALFHTFYNLVGLEITPGQAVAVFAGETAHFPLHLSNRRRRLRTALELRIDADTVRCNLPGNGNLTVLVPQIAARRGSMQAGRIVLSTRYPLGFFRAWAYPYPAMNVLVYPKPLTTPLPPLSPVENPGDRMGSGGQEDFAGLRLHRPSDPPRHIAWKAAARADADAPLLVKEFAGGAASELWLDFAQINGVDDEVRLSILTAWVLVAETQDIHYGLRLPGRVFEPGHGENHQQRCLEALALFGLAP